MSASPSFSLHRVEKPKPRPNDSELVFGRTFTDHMAIVDYDAERGWFDPRVVPYAPLALDPAAAVLHYAQEMFDGLKAFRGVDGKVRFFRIDRHCQRLHDGAERLCIPPVDPELSRAAITAFTTADCDWVPSSPGTSLYIRPTVIASEPFLGVRPAKRYIFFVIASPVGAYHGEAFAPAKILVEDRYVRAAVGGLGGVKAGANYIASLRAAEEAKARGFDQVLWTDAHEHRYLEEVGTMNMVARIGDGIVTPPLGGSILAGVTRDSVITLLREWGFTVNERPLGMEELLRAHRGGALREMFGCGTAAVITPVGTLGWKGEEVVINGGQPGEIARRLLEAITSIQYGRQPDEHGWMTEAGIDPERALRVRSARASRRAGCGTGERLNLQLARRGPPRRPAPSGGGPKSRSGEARPRWHSHRKTSVETLGARRSMSVPDPSSQLPLEIRSVSMRRAVEALLAAARTDAPIVLRAELERKSRISPGSRISRARVEGIDL